MEALKNYIIAVIAACICCGLIHKIAGQNKSVSVIMNVLCGTVLAITAISPLMNIKISNVDRFFDEIKIESIAYVQKSTENANQQMRQIITDKVSAYILEKTSSYNCSINSVQIFLADDDIPAPEALQIEGAFTPYVRNHLSEVFETNLGIPKENQQWIYQN